MALRVLWAICIMCSLSLSVRGDVYSSVSRMKNVARRELEMYKHATIYLAKERERLEKLER